MTPTFVRFPSFVHSFLRNLFLRSSTGSASTVSSWSLSPRCVAQLILIKQRGGERGKERRNTQTLSSKTLFTFSHCFIFAYGNGICCVLSSLHCTKKPLKFQGNRLPSPLTFLLFVFVRATSSGMITEPLASLTCPSAPL